MRTAPLSERPAAIATAGEPASARPGGAAQPFAERYQAAIAGLADGGGAAAASDGAPPSAAPVTVVEGDTLWSMVRHQLESRSECVSDGQVLAEVRRVSAANQLENPDLIVPGQRLDLGGGADASAAASVPPGEAAPSAGAALDPHDEPAAVAAPPGEPLEIGALIDGHRDRVTSAFGMRADPLCGKPRFHAGIDVAAATGTPARAAADGVVTFAGEQRGYGRVVVVDHGGGVSTVYAHASALLVREGDRVDTGTELVRVGASGRATGPHLHFELRKDGVAVDPTRLAHLLDDATRT